MFDHIRLLHILGIAALSVGLYRARRFLPGVVRVLPGKPRSTSVVGSRAGFILLEATEVTLAAVFLLVGGAKLVGQRDMIELFSAIGVGEWFRYVTGIVEVTAALLLVTPVLSGASAMALGVVMIVASLIELFVLHRPPIAAVACLGAHTFVAWSRVSGSAAQPVKGTVEAADARSVLMRGLTGRWRFPRRPNRSLTVRGNKPARTLVLASDGGATISLPHWNRDR